MFNAGEFYAERVTTGKITFDTDGIPTSSPMKHGTVFVLNKEVVPLLKNHLQPLPTSELEPECDYMRLFQAPRLTYDRNGVLIQPTFSTDGFYKNDEFCGIARDEVDRFAISKGLSARVLAYFKDQEKSVCPMTQVEAVQPEKAKA